MNDILPTSGQLERELSQKIQALYRTKLGHQPSKVTCQFFDCKLAIIIEDSITTAEQVLLDEGESKLAEKVRSNLDDAIQPELKQLVKNIAKVDAIDVLSDATLKTGRTGMIVVLERSPSVRNPESIPKIKK